jgi:PAS domain S-box-containing protein
MIKNSMPWIFLLGLLLGGVSGSYHLGQFFREEAANTWKTEVNQMARFLTETIQGWVEESYAPVLGLAVLFENSENVSKDEFLNAANTLESRATTLFIDSHAVSRLNQESNKWEIAYSSKPSGYLSPDIPLAEKQQVLSVIRTGSANPEQIILGPPVYNENGTDYAIFALATKDSQGPLVVIGLLNYSKLIQGLFAIHNPEGLKVHILGRFLELDGLGPLRTISGQPEENAFFSLTTRSVSARANLSFIWSASKEFSGGPQEQLADLIFNGGAAATLIIVLFLGFLLKQNRLIRIRVEEATGELAEKGKRLDLALSASGIGTWDWDIINNIPNWDYAHHQIMGTDPTAGTPDHQEFLGRIHPDDVNRLESRLKGALEGKTEYADEYRVINPHGGYKYIDSRAHVLRDSNSEPVRMIGTTMDITERKQAEDRLKQSQQQLKSLFEALPVGVTLISPSGIIREANAISERILGVSADEHKMRDLQSEEWKIIRPDGTEMPPEEYPATRALSGEGVVKNIEMGVFQPDGTLIWINTSAAPISESVGGGVAVAFEDITYRKESEKNLKKLSQAVEQSPVSVIITDPEGTIEYVNPRFCQVTGYSRAEAIGQNPRILKSERNPPETFKKMWETISSGKEWRGQLVNTKKNGDQYWESVSISPILSEDGSIQHYLAVKEDISLRKKIEEELARKSILMDAMIDSPRDIIIFSLDTEYRYTAFNKAHFLEMKRVYQVEIEAGMSMLDGISDLEIRQLVKNNLDRVLNGETYTEIQQQADSHIFYEFNWGVVRNNKQKVVGLSAFIRNISELKKLELELKNRVREQDEAQSAMLNMMEDLDDEKGKAEEATKAKSDFLANMSHEIRTPMNAIMGLTHLCLQTDLSDKQTDYLTKVHTSATSLLGLINDILDFSKIEAGKLEMESIEFDLDEVLNNISILVANKAQDKGLELLFKVPAEVPRFLTGDPLRLGQVLINLANNAVKFTESGEIVISVDLLQKTDQKASLRFTVRDTGIGLNDEQIEKLFRSFSQADTSITRKYGGTGLGLTISKRLVELMNGAIHVESEPGKGSSFIFNAEFEYQTGREKNKIVTIPDLKGTRTLVVDDNATSREIFNSMLKQFHFEVSLSKSGKEAIQIIKEADPPFEMVLMDWKMPGMDGIEAAKEIREKVDPANQPKIILATAFDREDARQEAGSISLDGFLNKPVTPSHLYDAILNAFGKKSGESKEQVDHAGLDRKSLVPIQGALILLVEDNEINQQVAQELLEGAGFVVDIANHGKEALEKLAGSRYDIVLMDIQMPIMDGYEATHEIRKNPAYQKLPVLAMTASATVDDRERALKEGLNDHIAKPIEPRLLFKALLKWVKPGKRTMPEIKSQQPATGKETSIELPDHIPGIDVASGIRRLGDNRVLYLKLLVKFNKNQANAVSEIVSALQSNDIETAERLAHTIKGVAGNIGAMDLYTAAQHLEAGIKEKGRSIADEMISETRSKLETVTTAIADLIEHSSTQSRETDDNSLLMDMVKITPLLKELEEYIQDDDTDALSVLEKLSPLVSGNGINNTLNSLEEALNDYDFDEALEQFEQLSDLLNDKKNG